MTSLLNVLMAEQVKSLLDDEKLGGFEDAERFFSREKTEAVIHAAIWAHGSRSGSTASAYAFMSLMDALGIGKWEFKTTPPSGLPDAEDGAAELPWRTAMPSKLVMVPKSATEEMRGAFYNNEDPTNSGFVRAFAAALAARPPVSPDDLEQLTADVLAAIQPKLYADLREWIEVTGITTPGCSYEYEMQSIIDDAARAVLRHLAEVMK